MPVGVGLIESVAVSMPPVGAFWRAAFCWAGLFFAAVGVKWNQEHLQGGPNMEEKPLNPAMLDYYNRHDRQARDLPAYSYRRLLARAEEQPRVPVPLYADPETVSAESQLYFTTDVTAVPGPTVLVMGADLLDKSRIRQDSEVLFDLPDGPEYWALCLHDVFHSGMHHTFTVDRAGAFPPDGEALCRILTAEEARALDALWREELKREGFRLFIQELGDLAGDGEEQAFVRSLQRRGEALQVWKD